MRKLELTFRETRLLELSQTKSPAAIAREIGLSGERVSQLIGQAKNKQRIQKRISDLLVEGRVLEAARLHLEASVSKVRYMLEMVRGDFRRFLLTDRVTFLRQARWIGPHAIREVEEILSTYKLRLGMSEEELEVLGSR